MTPEDLVDRIERAYAAARAANLAVLRLEVCGAEYEELGRLFGMPGGIRLYRCHPVRVPAARKTLLRAVAPAEVIARVTGVSYHPARVWYILREQLGWTWQRPARRATERDDAAIAHWVKQRWP